MKYFTIRLLLLGLIFSARTEAETIDLKALAEQARPAIALVVVMDASGKKVKEGTGFWVSKGGKLVTNCHVLRHGSSAVAQAISGRKFAVTAILAYDEEQDLALVQTDVRDVPFLKLVTSDKSLVDQKVGILSALVEPGDNAATGTVRSVFILGDYGWFSLSTPLWEGASGAPVLDAKGDVVGIVTGADEKKTVGLAIVTTGLAVLLAKESAPVSVSTFSATTAAENVIWSSLELRNAVAASLKGNQVEALKLLDRVGAEYPQSALVSLMRGCALIKMQSLTQGIIACQNAVKLRPGWAVGWSTLGMAYAEQKNWEEAIAAFQEAIRLKSTDPRVWRVLGICLDKHSELDKAVDVYQKSLQMNPKEGSTWVLLADLYCRVGKPADGIAAYQKALENNVAPPEGVWLNMGQTYLTLHQYADALKAWQRVTALNPKFADQVADSIEIESALAENNPATWIHLAVIHTGVGHPAKAKTAYLRLEKLDLNKARELAKDLPGITK